MCMHTHMCRNGVCVCESFFLPKRPLQNSYLHLKGSLCKHQHELALKCKWFGKPAFLWLISKIEPITFTSHPKSLVCLCWYAINCFHSHCGTHKPSHVASKSCPSKTGWRIFSSLDISELHFSSLTRLVGLYCDWHSGIHGGLEIFLLSTNLSFHRPMVTPQSCRHIRKATPSLIQNICYLCPIVDCNQALCALPDCKIRRLGTSRSLAPAVLVQIEQERS